MDPADLREVLIAEGVPVAVVDRASGHEWANGPGDQYAAHQHDYDKVLLCLAGTITFTLPATGRAVALRAGERLDLPAGTLHAASVGPAGVRCHETHLPAGTFSSSRA
ncbi:MAG: cupin [Candidatus Limnocylindrales bacterium]